MFFVRIKKVGGSSSAYLAGMFWLNNAGNFVEIEKRSYVIDLTENGQNQHF